MCPQIVIIMATFLIVVGVLAAVSVTSSNTHLKIKMASAASKYFYPDHPDASRFRINKGNYNQTMSTNGIKEEQAKAGSNQTLSHFCEDASSFCNYYHPDHPNAGQYTSVKGNNSSKPVTTYETNNGIPRHENSMGPSNKSLELPTCEDVSSSLCTYLYLNHSRDGLGDGNRKKSNHTPVIKTDVIDDKMIKDPIKEAARSYIPDNEKRNSHICEDSSPICIYFYPDHPDAGRSIKMNNCSQTIASGRTHSGSNQTHSTNCEDTSLYCTYFHPDHPDTDRIRKNMQSQTSTNNETNCGISQQQTIGSNQSIHIKHACKDSSSFCTFNYVNSDAFHKQKSNYTPIVTLIDAMLSNSSNKVGNISVEEHFIGLFNVSTRLSVNPTSPSTFSTSISDNSPKSTTGAENISSREHFTSLPTTGTSLSVKNTSPSTSAASISNNSPKSTTGESPHQVSNISDDEEYFTSLSNISTKQNVNPTSPSTSAVPNSNNNPKSTTAVVVDIFVKGHITRLLPNINTKLSVNVTSPLTSTVSTEKSTEEEYVTSLPSISSGPTTTPTSPSTFAVSMNKKPKTTTSIKAAPGSSRNWKTGQKGTKWDNNCDFNGNDIGFCVTTLEQKQCVEMCISNGDCTHWTHRSGLLRLCCLKKANYMTGSFDLLANCGFIPGRSRQN